MTAVQSIYSHYVLHDLCSFEEEVPGVEQMQARRADVIARGMPYLVAMLDGEVAGYAYATAYRARSAYRHTVEDSVYVAQGMHGHGIGKALLFACLEDMKHQGFGYAIIGGVGPAEFYAKAVGAVAIEGSAPGIYRGLL